jgi:hypothetical protein
MMKSSWFPSWRSAGLEALFFVIPVISSCAPLVSIIDALIIFACPFRAYMKVLSRRLWSKALLANAEIAAEQRVGHVF